MHELPATIAIWAMAGLLVVWCVCLAALFLRMLYCYFFK